ncbi:hypothetical protein DCC85_14930 [Paenibacillus sp. CAA11]|nr:hypothetical protein DCC85_14930 [Paenibacillus sp. CAA11]
MTGVIIVAAGIIILLGKWGVFSFLGSALWPLLFLIPGILLHLLYIGRKVPAAALVPGGILVIYGLLFCIGNLWGWQTLRFLWPGFILGIGAGLLEFDRASRFRQPGILSLALGLIAISILLFVITLLAFSAVYLIALILIIGGLGLIGFRGRNRRGW